MRGRRRGVGRPNCSLITLCLLAALAASVGLILWFALSARGKPSTQAPSDRWHQLSEATVKAISEMPDLTRSQKENLLSSIHSNAGSEAGQKIGHHVADKGAGETFGAVDGELLKKDWANMVNGGLERGDGDVAPKSNPVVENLRGRGVEVGGNEKSFGRSTAVVVMCYNRPEYLSRTLDTIMSVFPRESSSRPRLYVSQDGHDRDVHRVIESKQKMFFQMFAQTEDVQVAAQQGVVFEHWVHEQSHERGDDMHGYAKLARHFGWALGRLFSHGYERVIILEDDLEIGADFFEMFEALAPRVDTDPTVLAASAYNDVGQPQNVGDPNLILRSDFFPGLGWMMPKRIWNELGPKWPTAYWDDWLREPPQRRGRHILRPDVSRSRTFGRKGVSMSQFFDKYLGNIHLQETPMAWSSTDLSYLELAQWDAALSTAISTSAATESHLIKHEKTVPKCTTSKSTAQTPLPPGLVLTYRNPHTYTHIAHELGLIDDAKAGVPRTAYNNVVTITRASCRIYIAPETGPTKPQQSIPF